MIAWQIFQNWYTKKLQEPFSFATENAEKKENFSTVSVNSVA